MYKYYREISTGKHFCFASEICNSFGVYSNKNKPYVRFFTYFYDEYCKITGIDKDRLYYKTQNGLVRVFPELSAIASFAICIGHELKHNNDNDNNRITIKISDKSFNIVVDVIRFKNTYEKMLGVKI